MLVNNAGIMPLGQFVDEDDLTAQRMVDINVHGVMYGMKLALPRMQRRGRGHLVNLASQAGKAGFPGGATYCGTKHFVVGVSEAVRAELRDTDIEISVVMPAVVNTELGSGLPETRAIKVLQPEDVADAIVDALERPKFDVWVPRESVGIYKFMQLLPRGAREGDRPPPEGRQGARRGRPAAPAPPTRTGPRTPSRRSTRRPSARARPPRPSGVYSIALSPAASAKPSTVTSPIAERLAAVLVCVRGSSRSPAWSGSRRRRTP